MKCNGLTPVLMLAALLAMATTNADEPAPAALDSPDQEFTYNDDWALVSAPPPPGPYQGVNLDPRIPGQEDNIHPSMAAPTMPAQMTNQMMERFANAPPAAGQPSIPPQRPVQTARQIPWPQQPIQRGYGRAPAPGAYPPAVSQGWGRAPAGRMVEQVPPPAVYNRMTSPPPGPFGYYGRRY